MNCSFIGISTPSLFQGIDTAYIAALAATWKNTHSLGGYQNKGRKRMQLPHIKIVALHRILLAIAHNAVLRIGIKLDGIKAAIQQRGDRRIAINVCIHHAARNAPVRIQIHKDQLRFFFRFFKSFVVAHPMHQRLCSRSLLSWYCTVQRSGRRLHEQAEQDKQHHNNLRDSTPRHFHHFTPPLCAGICVCNLRLGLISGAFAFSAGRASSESMRALTAFWNGTHWRSSFKISSVLAKNCSRV